MSLALELEDPEFERAVNRDLIDLGLRLRWLCDGTDRLNWEDLLDIVENSAPESAVYRHVQGGIPGWTMTDYQIANLIDAVNGLAWGLAGGKEQDRPDPAWRPSMKDKITDHTTESSGGFGGIFGADFEEETMSLEEANAFLGIKIA